MLEFIKRFFGFDQETLKDAGVKLTGENCPYKVEVPAQKPRIINDGQTKKPTRKPRNRKPRVPPEPSSK